MSAERMEAMRDICYSYEVRTKVRGMKCVLVIEKDGSVRQRIPYDEKNGAIIYLYDKESRIVWESVEGRHYTDSIPYETKRLFYEPRFVVCAESMRHLRDSGIRSRKKKNQIMIRFWQKESMHLMIKMYFWYAAGGSEKKIIQKMIF